MLKKFKDNPRKIYASMMWSMDEAIGSVVDKLKENNQYDNTIIYFLSDNGAAMSNDASPFPFKGWKGNQYEGGIKTPMIMTWKNRIEPETQFDGFISSLDIFKTSLEVSGVDQSLLINADGKNIINSLNDKKVYSEDLFWRKDKMATMRQAMEMSTSQPIPYPSIYGFLQPLPLTAMPVPVTFFLENFLAQKTITYFFS